MAKKVLILFLLVACGSSIEDTQTESEINTPNLLESIEEVDIYKYGEGPYSLDQCTEIGSNLKENIFVTTLYIQQIENWTQYINSSDNLETWMYWDNLLGFKLVKHLNEAKEPYGNIKNFYNENELKLYLRNHLKDINKIYIAKDIDPKGPVGVTYDFKELSIMTLGSDKEFHYLIEFTYDEENLYFIPSVIYDLNEKNESYERVENYLKNAVGYNSSIFVDTGHEYRGKQSNNSRGKYFYNNLVSSYDLISNGEFSNSWYINILDIHLESLNKLSFFLNQFTECQGSLEFSGIQEKLKNQYKGIENRRTNYINFTSSISGIVYPLNDWDYTIRFDLLN